MNFPDQGFQKLERYRQTDTQTQTDATECITTPHSRVAKINRDLEFLSFTLHLLKNFG